MFFLNEAINASRLVSTVFTRSVFNASLTDTAVASRRSDLLESLGFDPAVDVDFGDSLPQTLVLMPNVAPAEVF